MADINIERKRRSSWTWLLLLLLVLVIAAAAWWFLAGRGGADNPLNIGQDTATATSGAAYDPATAPPYPATPADTAAR